ncbi:MAG: D-aminoacylase domain protein [Gemmatimonadetes bacterium]|jgi:N-acyl-D-aspartate/D-glutamate deacylase|nr:D-aminoacylase domain protein [Gemmatimonadota bacterium]
MSPSPISPLAALTCALLLLSGARVQAQHPASVPGQRFDLLIRGGRVLDGTGNPWVHADIGIRGDRIATIGNLAGSTATTVVDARGLYVSPGFIDTHSHAGEALETEALSAARPILAQGVTTVFINPDGGGRADLAAQRRLLDARRLGVNVGLMVPHGSVRQAVLGMEDRAPSAAELQRMEAMVAQGFEAGAFALSSGPFYAPGSFARTGELVALARIAARYGGPYQSHIRDESDYGIGLLAAIEEVITIARDAGTRGVVTHVKALGPNVWGFSGAIVQRIERARAQGVEVFADQYPYDASQTSLSAALVPRWAQAGGAAALRQRLASGERERIVREMRENLARRGGAARIRIGRYVPDSTIEGQSLAQITTARGGDTVEVALALLARGDAAIVSYNMDDDDIARLMTQPWTMTASDGALVPAGQGVPHPRGNGAFARKLRKYVVEDRTVDLAAAVRSMTSLPATVYGVTDRGLLRPGAVADIAVFDLARVRDRATFEDPHQLAEGMVHVLVNGRIAVREGTVTAERAGRVLAKHGGR